MNKIERVDAVVSGRSPDRPPVSFWHHFGPGAVSGPEAVGAHLRHLETYDLDFLKVMDDKRYPRTFNRSGVLTGQMQWTGTGAGFVNALKAAKERYLATRADLTPGPDGSVLTIEFGAPTPLGMLR